MRPRRPPDNTVAVSKKREEFFGYALTVIDIYPTWFEVQFESLEQAKRIRCSIPSDNKVLRLLCRGYQKNVRLEVKKDTMKMGVYRVFGRVCGTDDGKDACTVLQDVVFSPITVKKSDQ